MNITYGIVLICVAVVMIWFARPADGVSLPWFKKAWIIGQLYIMTAMVLFVMGSATILGNTFQTKRVCRLMALFGSGAMSDLSP